MNLRDATRSGLLRIAVTTTTLGALAVCAPRAAAQANAGSAPKVTVDAYVSLALTHNTNDPPSELNGLRVFDLDDDDLAIEGELVVQRAVSAPGELGFRIDLAAGSNIPRVSAASGLFRDSATGEAEDIDLQQAYISYVAPLGKGLRLDFGKHVTHAGAELIPGYDGDNDQYSRSFLFGYAIPFTHTGLKAGYAFSPKVTLVGMLLQGWDNFKDNNDGKTLGAQLALTPTPAFTAYLNWLYGAERAQSADKRRLFDLVAVWKPVPRVALSFNWDLAREKNGAGPGRDAEWNGLAGSLKLGLGGGFSLVARAERFEDTHGVRTGAEQTLKEFTGGLELRARGLLLRGELRRDSSDRAVFESDGGPSRRQTTLAGNVAYSF